MRNQLIDLVNDVVSSDITLAYAREWEWEAVNGVAIISNASNGELVMLSLVTMSSLSLLSIVR